MQKRYLASFVGSALIVFIIPRAHAVSALSVSSCSHQPMQNVSFQQLETWGARMPLGKAAIQLVALNQDDGSEGENCSGAFISDQGHFMTAAHCLDICKQSRGNQPGTCPVKINGRQVSAVVVMLPNCPSMSEYLQTRTNPSDELRSCSRDKDMAILKIPPPSDFSCLPVAAHTPGLGEQVFTLGFPNATSRSGTSQSQQAQGNALSLSTGKIVQQDFCTLSDGSAVDMGGIPGQKLRDDPRFFQTTVDTQPGSSGGALINNAGEIVGISSLIASKRQNSDSECSGSTFFTKAEQVGSGYSCVKHRATATATGSTGI